MDEIFRQWAENMKVSRRVLGLSQADLAARVGVRQATVARWESGKRPPADIYKVAIARALQRDVRQLFPLVAGVR